MQDVVRDQLVRQQPYLLVHRMQDRIILEAVKIKAASDVINQLTETPGLETEQLKKSLNAYLNNELKRSDEIEKHLKLNQYVKVTTGFKRFR